MKRFDLKVLGLVGLALGLSFAPQASATIIDFESVATGGCQVTAGGSTAGFTLTGNDATYSGGFNNSTSCSHIAPTANSGTQYMVNFNSRIGAFTKDSGVFALNSVFVHADIREGATTVRLQGLGGLGGSVLFSKDVAIDTSWQKVVFVGWTGVKTFTWDPISPDSSSNVAIDDFEYNAAGGGGSGIPEPGTLAIFGFGLAGLGYMRRRRPA